MILSAKRSACVIVPDVNVLINAIRPDSAFHGQARAWLDRLLKGDEPMLLPDVVMVGFIRIVTNPRIQTSPTPMPLAIAQMQVLLADPISSRLETSATHWLEFNRLLQLPGIRGNLVTDAYIAALAIGSGARLATSDRDFRRFPGLEVIDPLVR
jgi:toxin-antitoxin system PIN domain toxin